MEEQLGALAARFLKPDRGRLEALRALARQAGSVPALMTALGTELPGGLPKDPSRWFRMTAREASLDHGDSTRRTLAVTSGRSEPVLERPPTLASAVLYLSDPAAMVHAERAARAFARRWWAFAGLSGSPPTDVVWRLCGTGSTPSSYQRFAIPLFDQRQLEALSSRLPAARPLGLEWTDAFRRVAEVVALGEAWESAQMQGQELGESPVEPFLELWLTGLGLWSLTPDCVTLFAPERHDTPSRQREIPVPQPQLDAALAQLCRDPGTAVEALESLLARGADPNVGLSGLVWGGPIRQLTEKVRRLLAAGADPVRKDPYGALPLLRWLSQGELGPFLEAGWPLSAADAQGRTIVHHAVCPVAQPDALEELLAAGAPVNTPDAQGMTPLHVALLHGQDEVLDRLLAAGADPHQVTADGRTVYHLAAAGVPPDRLPAVVERFALLGVRNVPDTRGWMPEGALPAGTSVKFPWPLEPKAPPPSLGLWAVRDVAIPDELVRAVHEDEPGSWEVLGDLLQHEDDLRGELVALGLAEDRGQTPRGTLDAELARLLPLLLAPFAEAHPLGMRFVVDSTISFTWRRGLLWSLSMTPERYEQALPALLGSPATRFLYGLHLTVRDATSLPELWPRSLPIRQLSLVAQGGEARLPLSSERLPALRTLSWRAPPGARLEIAHDTLQTLRVEHPYQPDASWRFPLEALTAPSLNTLQLVASAAPRPRDRGWGWLLSLLAYPPASLHTLELRPVSPELLEALLASRALPQLRSLVLSSVKASLLEPIEANARRLAHLETLSIRVLDLTRDQRALQQARLNINLPRLILSGIQYRALGGY